MRDCRGNITIEISFILPMILMILTVLFYFMCALHDRGILQAYARKAVMKYFNKVICDQTEDGRMDMSGRQEKGLLWRWQYDFEGETAELRDWLEQELQNKLFLRHDLNVLVEADSNGIAVELEEQAQAEGEWRNFWNMRGWKVREAQSWKQEEDFVRLCRAALVFAEERHR